MDTLSVRSTTGSSFGRNDINDSSDDDNDDDLSNINLQEIHSLHEHVLQEGQYIPGVQAGINTSELSFQLYDDDNRINNKNQNEQQRRRSQQFQRESHATGISDESKALHGKPHQQSDTESSSESECDANDDDVDKRNILNFSEDIQCDVVVASRQQTKHVQNHNRKSNTPSFQQIEVQTHIQHKPNNDTTELLKLDPVPDDMPHRDVEPIVKTNITSASVAAASLPLHRRNNSDSSSESIWSHSNIISKASILNDHQTSNRSVTEYPVYNDDISFTNDASSEAADDTTPILDHRESNDIGCIIDQESYSDDSETNSQYLPSLPPLPLHVEDEERQLLNSLLQRVLLAEQDTIKEQQDWDLIKILGDRLFAKLETMVSTTEQYELKRQQRIDIIKEKIRLKRKNQRNKAKNVPTDSTMPIGSSAQHSNEHQIKASIRESLLLTSDAHAHSKNYCELTTGTCSQTSFSEDVAVPKTNARDTSCTNGDLPLQAMAKQKAPLPNSCNFQKLQPFSNTTTSCDESSKPISHRRVQESNNDNVTFSFASLLDQNEETLKRTSRQYSNRYIDLEYNATNEVETNSDNLRSQIETYAVDSNERILHDNLITRNGESTERSSQYDASLQIRMDNGLRELHEQQSAVVPQLIVAKYDLDVDSSKDQTSQSLHVRIDTNRTKMHCGIRYALSNNHDSSIGTEIEHHAERRVENDQPNATSPVVVYSHHESSASETETTQHKDGTYIVPSLGNQLRDSPQILNNSPLRVTDQKIIVDALENTKKEPRQQMKTKRRGEKRLIAAFKEKENNMADCNDTKTTPTLKQLQQNDVIDLSMSPPTPKVKGILRNVLKVRKVTDESTASHRSNHEENTIVPSAVALSKSNIMQDDFQRKLRRKHKRRRTEVGMVSDTMIDSSMQILVSAHSAKRSSGGSDHVDEFFLMSESKPKKQDERRKRAKLREQKIRFKELSRQQIPSKQKADNTALVLVHPQKAARSEREQSFDVQNSEIAIEQSSTSECTNDENPDVLFYNPRQQTHPHTAYVVEVIDTATNIDQAPSNRQSNPLLCDQENWSDMNDASGSRTRRGLSLDGDMNGGIEVERITFVESEIAGTILDFSNCTHTEQSSPDFSLVRASKVIPRTLDGKSVFLSVGMLREQFFAKANQGSKRMVSLSFKCHSPTSFLLIFNGPRSFVDSIMKELNSWIKVKLDHYNFLRLKTGTNTIEINVDPKMIVAESFYQHTMDGKYIGLFINMNNAARQLITNFPAEFAEERGLLLQVNGKPCNSTRKFRLLKSQAMKSGVDLSLVIRFASPPSVSAVSQVDQRTDIPEISARTSQPTIMQLEDGNEEEKYQFSTAASCITDGDSTHSLGPQVDNIQNKLNNEKTNRGADLTQNRLLTTNVRTTLDIAKSAKMKSNQSKDATVKSDDFIEFSKKYMKVVDIEYDDKDVKKLSALIRMWKQHKKKYGESCGKRCECHFDLPFLAEKVIVDHVKNGVNPLQDGKFPIGFVGHFAETFLPKLRNIFPNESGNALLDRLRGLWPAHVTHVDPICSKRCLCFMEWENIFKETLCTPVTSKKRDKIKNRNAISNNVASNPIKTLQNLNEAGVSTNVLLYKCGSDHRNVDATTLLPSSNMRSPRRKRTDLNSTVPRKKRNKVAPQSNDAKLDSFAEYDVLFSCNKALGFYSETVSTLENSRCQIQSVYSEGQNKTETRIRSGTVVLSIAEEDGLEWTPITTHIELKEQFEIRKHASRMILLKMINTYVTLSHLQTSAVRKDWTAKGQWRGKENVGWDGGAASIDPRHAIWAVKDNEKLSRSKHISAEEKAGDTDISGCIDASSILIDTLRPFVRLKTPSIFKPSTQKDSLSGKSKVRFKETFERRIYYKGSLPYHFWVVSGDVAGLCHTVISNTTSNLVVAKEDDLECVVGTDTSDVADLDHTVISNTVSNLPVVDAKEEDLEVVVGTGTSERLITVLTKGALSSFKKSHRLDQLRKKLKIDLEDAAKMLERDPTNHHILANKREICRKDVILKVYINSIFVITNSQALKHWERFEVAIEGIEDLELSHLSTSSQSTLRAKAALIHGTNHGEAEILLNMPEWKLDRQIDFRGYRQRFFVNHNQNVSDRVIDVSLAMVIPGGDDTLLGSIEFHTSQLSIICEGSETFKFHSFFASKNDYINKAKLNIRVRKVNLDPVDYIATKQKLLQKSLSSICDWIERFNKDEDVIFPADIRILSNLSLLHASIFLGDISLVERLLKLGANPAITSDIGTPLEVANKMLMQKSSVRNLCEVQWVRTNAADNQQTSDSVFQNELTNQKYIEMLIQAMKKYVNDDDPSLL